jgi:hypothetical protein
MGSPPFIAVGSKGMLQLHIRIHAHRALAEAVSAPTTPDAKDAQQCFLVKKKTAGVVKISLIPV